MNDHNDNPYAPPNVESLRNDEPTDVRSPLPAKARPVFRVLAAGIACLMFSLVLFPGVPLNVGTAMSVIPMALIGLQFFFAAITGRWLTFGNAWRRE